MLIQPEESGKDTYDRFRGRLMIPIRDPRGRVIAFGGRILGDGEPKYLNSPDTPLFDKGRTLYNIDRAGPASRDRQAPDRRRRLYGRDRARPRRHRRSGRAQRHRGDRGPARAHVAARSLADPVLRRRQRRAARPRSAPRSAPCPSSAPSAPCASSSCPPARTPTTSSAAGGREAFEALLAKPEPLDARLWRHELEAEPLATPEAWAGLKQRLIDHAATIGHPDLARTLSRGLARPLLRAAPPARSAPIRTRQPQRRAAASRTAASCPPSRPSATRRRADRLDRHRRADRPRSDPRFRQFPRGAAGPLRAARRASDRRPAAPRKLRDELVNAAFSGAALDREALATILGADGAAGGQGKARPAHHGLFLHPPRQRPGPRPKRSGCSGRDHRRGGGGGKGPGAMQPNG